MNNSKRVILNTAFLYGKMLITIVVSLYSTRLILNALGVSDYGVFNLVAGVIMLLSFLNAAMTTSTQRYLSYAMGAGDVVRLKEIFKTSVFLHLIIGLFVVVVLEIAGIFLFENFLNIPPQRIEAAQLVYHFMVVSTFFTINAVPYDSAINAHEDLYFDAIAGVLDILLKLAVAFSLFYVTTDRLAWYGFFFAFVTIVNRIVKSTFCFIKYPETKISNIFAWNISLFREMFSFACWNLFGALCFVGRSQGLAVILNLFYGTVVNAAYGIANQVNGTLLNFAQNMMKALNPQILKSEGGNDRQRMLLLAMCGSKYAFFLLAFFAMPLIFTMPFVLKIWLKTVPQYAVIFCRLTLLVSMVNMLTIGLKTALQATGKIKGYQSTVGGILLLNLPLAWILLRIGFPAYSVLVSAIAIEIFASTLRVYFLHTVASLSVAVYMRKVILPTVLVALFCGIVLYIVSSNVKPDVLRFCMVCCCSSFSLCFAVYYIGLDRDERDFVSGALVQRGRKFFS